VLRPGGRIGISDVVADDALTPEQRAERGSYVGCIAGALSFGEFEASMRTAGFEAVRIISTDEPTEGIHSAIIQGTKRIDAEETSSRMSRELPLTQPSCC
jgi:arsenite methyltransferase